MLLFLPDYKTRLNRKAVRTALGATNSVKEMGVEERAFMNVDQKPQIKFLDLRASNGYAK